MPTIRIHDEADETIEICAIINGLPAEGLESDITIDLDVKNGSAGDFTSTMHNVYCTTNAHCTFVVAGEDFVIILPTSLNFSSNQSLTNGDSVCLRITINDDNIYEEDQEFNISIADVAPSSVASIGEDSIVTVIIQDNYGMI